VQVKKLMELKQVVLARLLPPQFEHHFAFSLPQIKNDPFLCVIVRPWADYGHEQVYDAIIDSTLNSPFSLLPSPFSFILYPLSFILYPLSFILYPLSFTWILYPLSLL
jgi:hypothetical protein